MVRHWCWTALFSLSALWAAAGPRTGSLVVAGGGRLGPEIGKRFVELAGGPDALIVIIPTAGEGEKFDSGLLDKSFLREAGARNLVLLHTRDRKVADSEAFVAPLRKAGGVWFSGGRQWRLVDSYLNTRTHRELNALLQRGGVIGGSSAGATIQGSYLVRGAREGNHIMMAKGYEEGLGFLKGVAVDQHLIARRREKDMLAVIAAHPELLGIGIDERTAVIVQSDRMEVAGESKTAIYDAGYKPRDDGRPYYFLAAGDVFDLKKRTVLTSSPFRFREIGATGLELSENGKPIYVYNFGMILKPGFPEEMSRSSYLHPVYTPDGTVITDDFNPDHAHHRGISWMWPVVVVDGKTYDVWTVKDMKQKFVRWTARDLNARSATLGVENGWYIGDRKVVKEFVEVVAHGVEGNRRRMDFKLRFEAVDSPVEIAGTPDQQKGFGGFCMRFAPRDGGSARTVIRTDQGISEKDGVMSRHPWAEITGTFQGRPAGARIEDNPSNSGYPKNGWLMRHGFGFLNVSWPGLSPHTMKPGTRLELKYRVIVFSGG